MPPCSAFDGLAPRWFTSDRLYRIYVTDAYLCGAWIAGQFHDQRTAALVLYVSYGLFQRRLARSFQRQEQRRSRYDEMDPASRAFLAEDDRNFQIHRNEIMKMTVDRKRSLWTPYNVGAVNLELVSGGRRRFILVGDQDAEAIAGWLSLFCPQAWIAGK